MPGRTVNASRQIPPSHPLYGRKTWLPRMSDGSAQLFAAVLRSIGVDAEVTPPSDDRTSELGGRFTSGDECYPLKVTLGDFLRVVKQPGFDPKKNAIFMATGHGPCRFGQYERYFRSVLQKSGYGEVAIVAPSAERGYTDFGEASGVYTRSAWRAIVAGDILLKLLLKTRPYEIEAGEANEVFEASVRSLCKVLQVSYASSREQMSALQSEMIRVREAFRNVRVNREAGRPLIGAVGEIFCRLNTFSNAELVQRLEEAGAEVWMNDISEWIWYINADEFRAFRVAGRRMSLEAFAAQIRNHFQHRDEHALISLFAEDFRGYEEPGDIRAVLQFAEPYLPYFGANGEMVVNVGKAVYFARKGLDGVIDISPFGCMNGIVGEAIYPRVSRDNAGIPIRNFYFDGTRSDLDRDIGIFLELARSYKRTKPWPTNSTRTSELETVSR